MDKDQIELDQDQINNIAKWDQFFKDAKLGRLVRKLAATNYVLSPVQIYQAKDQTLEHIATRWTIQQWIGNGSDGLEDIIDVCDTPEEALTAAGIKDD